jgi:anti-sigma B factor antagonist
VSAPRSLLRVTEIEVETPAVRVFSVAGELNLATVGQLRDSVGSVIGPTDRVVLDLSETTFCDSTGLGALVGLHRQARGVGGVLVLAAPRKRVADLLELSGVNQVIEVFPTREKAVLQPD